MRERRLEPPIGGEDQLPQVRGTELQRNRRSPGNRIEEDVASVGQDVPSPGTSRPGPRMPTESLPLPPSATASSSRCSSGPSLGSDMIQSAAGNATSQPARISATAVPRRRLMRDLVQPPARGDEQGVHEIPQEAHRGADDGQRDDHAQRHAETEQQHGQCVDPP